MQSQRILVQDSRAAKNGRNDMKSLKTTFNIKGGFFMHIQPTGHCSKLCLQKCKFRIIRKST
jgi:hypothetical protein